MPSFAPSTPARNQPARWLRWRSMCCMGSAYDRGSSRLLDHVFREHVEPAVAWSAMLRLVLPKGRSRRRPSNCSTPPTCGSAATPSSNYRAAIDDPRIDEVRILRPQEIPRYVAEGLFDLGITGRDWVEETGSDVVSLGELHYSKATDDPVRIVLAVAGDSPVETGRRICPTACGCRREYPELTQRFFDDEGHQGRHPAVLRRDRGQGARHRRLHRRHHRDGQRAACRRPARSSTRCWCRTPSWWPTPSSYADPDKRHAMHQTPHAAPGRARGPRQGAREAQRVRRSSSTRSSTCCRR